jgi:hypothetical protein
MPIWLTSLLDVLVKFLLGLIAQKEHDKALKQSGRTEGAADLQQVVSEAADDQAHVNAVDRGNAGDVLGRLRSRL